MVTPSAGAPRRVSRTWVVMRDMGFRNADFGMAEEQMTSLA
jgi:hypothetical protein